MKPKKQYCSLSNPPMEQKASFNLLKSGYSVCVGDYREVTALKLALRGKEK